MGLALGRSIGEVRALPYPEYRSWQLFYTLEPWGWHNEEYYAATLFALLYNINRGKGKAKEPKEFMRDLPKALLQELNEGDPLEGMTLEEQREYLIRQIKKDFGIK